MIDDCFKEQELNDYSLIEEIITYIKIVGTLIYRQVTTIYFF